jgi:membrane-associated phospholipid phosphatase
VSPSLRLPLAALSAAGLLLLTILAVVYAGGTTPGGLDLRVQSFVDRNSPADLDAALAVDWFGEPAGRVVAVLVVAAICLLAGRRRLAVVAVLGPILVTLLTTGLKDIVDRRIHGDFLSYPSGHTAFATSLGLVVGLLLADVLRTGALLGTAVVLGCGVLAGGVMAWFQTDLEAHYPTDTLGGFGCALLVIPLTALLVERVRRRPGVADGGGT